VENARSQAGYVYRLGSRGIGRRPGKGPEINFFEGAARTGSLRGSVETIPPGLLYGDEVGQRLVDGVYEDVITVELRRALDLLGASKAVDVVDLRPADAPVVLARFLRTEIERALADVEGAKDDKFRRQVALANDILRLLVERKLLVDEQLVAEPAKHLRGIHAHETVAPGRPETPLAESTILTLGQREPRIGSELAREIESADRVDALVSFVTKGGVARLPGVQVKISYDGRRTRLHAKAWLFHRATGAAATGARLPAVPQPARRDDRRRQLAHDRGHDGHRPLRHDARPRQRRRLECWPSAFE
jgi:hypothetical protein